MVNIAVCKNCAYCDNNKLKQTYICLGGKQIVNAFKEIHPMTKACELFVKSVRGDVPILKTEHLY